VSLSDQSSGKFMGQTDTDLVSVNGSASPPGNNIASELQAFPYKAAKRKSPKITATLHYQVETKCHKCELQGQNIAGQKSK